MSTFNDIQALIKAGKLREYKPLEVHRDFQYKRQLFVCEEVYMACPPSDGMVSRKGMLPNETRYAARQIMRTFLGGDLMTEEAQIKFLAPIENQVWELKAIPPSRHKQASRFIFSFLIKSQTRVFRSGDAAAANKRPSSHCTAACMVG